MDNKLKIGFCFLSIDDVFYPHAWNSYFNGIDKSKYEVLIHTKNETDIELKAIHFNNCVPNEWKSLLGLHLFLLNTAKNMRCDKVVFISDSTLPIHSFDTFYEFCKEIGEKSVIPTDNTQYLINDERQPQNELRGFLTHGHNWTIIDKKHFDIILNYPDIEYYKNLIFADEHFIPTYFKKLGILESECMNQITTYVNWQRPAPSHPYVFKELTDEISDEITFAKKYCFFIRKIDKNADEQLIKEILNF